MILNMNKLEKINSILCLTLLTLITSEAMSPLMAAEFLNYKVKKGDTIGEILGNLGVCPIWGTKRSVSQTISLNPGVLKDNGNFVRPYRMIRIPVESLPESNEYQVSGKEVSFTVTNPELKCGVSSVTRKKNETEIRTVAEEIFEGDAPVDVPEVVLAPVAEAPNDTDAFGILRATTDLFYSAMDVKDRTTGETAQILSRINTAFQFAWEQQWDKKNRTFLFYRTEKYSYEAVEDKMPAKTYNLHGFGVGYHRNLTSRWNLRFTTRTQERLFIRATTSTDLEMDKSIISEFNLSPIYHLYNKGLFNLYADLGLSYLMTSKTSDYSIKAGNRYLAGLSLTQTIKDFELSGRTYYSVENQDSSIITKTTKDLGISLGIAWSFKK